MRWPTGSGPAPELGSDPQGAPDDEPQPAPAALERMSLQWTFPALPPALTSTPAVATPAGPAFEWAAATAAAVGTVAHRLVARIAEEGVDAWPAARVASESARLAIALGREGVPLPERAQALRRVVAAVERTLADPRGRWLFDPTHAEAGANGPSRERTTA